MLDVHPPHAPTHTWRDFFIHIATIVVGLLIAVGLEQTVEAIHHHREIREARDEMQADIDVDRRIAATDLRNANLLHDKLKRDMALLLAHRDTNQPLTANLDFDATFITLRNAAWTANRQSGVFNLMPHAEIEYDDYVFGGCDSIMQSSQQWGMAGETAKAIATRYPGGQLSPKDTDELITAISTIESKLAWTVALIGYIQSALNLPTHHLPNR